jgi:two-component system response regulator (stage 0 sporulation protein A)
MVRDLKIVIADKSPVFGQACASLLRNYGFEVFLTPKDGVRLMQAVVEHQPGIVLCDMILPNLDALGVLAEIGKLNFKVKPAVMLLSAFDNPRLEQAAFRAGATYYFIRPVSAETLVARILLFAETASGEESLQAASVQPAGTAPAKPDLEPIAAAVVRKLGIQAHLQGYTYLRDALVLLVQDPDIIYSVTKKLYARVAQKHGTTPSKVERSIRHAIGNAYVYGDPDAWQEYLGMKPNPEKRQPINSHFIAQVAESLRFRLKHL